MNKKVCLVTGSACNLGKSTIIKYASNNYDVVITYNNSEDDANKLKDYIISTYNVKCLCIKCNITIESDIENLLSIIKKEFNRLDVLINNAAIDITDDFNNKNKDNYMKVLETNVVGTFLVSKIIGSYMYENKTGVITNISSNNAIDDYNECSLEYDSSKAAIINLTHNLANHYSPYIRVNAICPGWINTKSVKEMNPNFIKSEKEKILLNRFAEESEIASLLYFLSSNEASYINDSIIKIDGGKKC